MILKAKVTKCRKWKIGRKGKSSIESRKANRIE